MMTDNKEEAVEPGIQQELDCMNTACERINQLENDLSKKRNLYRQTLSESTQNLEFLSNRLGDCVNKARPYFDAVMKAKDAQHEIQVATINFERAVSMHDAAKEMVLVAEQGMLKDTSDKMDTAWPEMLNHATIKVNDAEADRHRSELEHERCAELFKKAQREVYRLEKKLKTAISKSRPYFEAKKIVQKRLEDLSDGVKDTELELSASKHRYSMALKSLEEISESIHKSRGTYVPSVEELGTRQEGVGAESTPQASPSLSRINSSSKDFMLKNAVINSDGDAWAVEKSHTTENRLSEKLHAGSSETIGSLRSSGSGTSETSVTDLSQEFEQLSSSTKPIPDKLTPSPNVSHKKRTEVLLSVAALESYVSS